MIRFSLIIIGLIGLCARVMAHNPQIVTYTIRNQYNIWLVEASFPQVSVQNALIKSHGKNEVNNYDEATYRNKIINLFREVIQLSANNRKLMLGDAAIKLGSHQTDVKFMIKNFPNHLDEFNLTVEIESLPFNEKQQNIVRVIAYDQMERQILSKSNTYKGAFRLTKDGIYKLDIKSEENNMNTLILSITLVFATVILAVFLIQQRSAKTISI